MSTSYQFVRAKKCKVTCPPNVDVSKAVSNVTLVQSAVDGAKNVPFISIKMDSTYGDQRARWNPVDNNIYGEKSAFMPAIIWPTCCHKNEDL